MESLVFVAHRVAGIHRIPAAWLDGYMPSGFRMATAAEIAFWHEERGLDPPPLRDADPEGAAEVAGAHSEAPPGATPAPMHE
jgi:hypothetical protein